MWRTPSQFGEEFERQWNAAHHSFKKLECAPVFVEDDDQSFELFVQGNLTEAREIVRTRVLGQRDMYHELTERGGTIQRLRVIGRPVTPYINEYEIAAYDAAKTIGEQVRFVSESKIPADLQSVCRDFLMFDNRSLLVHEYTPWGRMLGGWYIDEVDILAECSSAWARLESIAAQSLPVRPTAEQPS